MCGFCRNQLNIVHSHLPFQNVSLPCTIFADTLDSGEGGVHSPSWVQAVFSRIQSPWQAEGLRSHESACTPFTLRVVGALHQAPVISCYKSVEILGEENTDVSTLKDATRFLSFSITRKNNFQN